LTTYPLGALVELDTAVTDDSGNPTDATVTLAVVQPDLTTVNPAVSHSGASGSGLYTASLTADQVGTYTYLWSASGTVTTSDAGQFDTGNPAPPLYASVADLRARLNILDNTKDALLFDALGAASREVEDDCGGRRFWLDPAPVARIFDPQHRVVHTPRGEQLLVDDIGATQTLIVEVGSEVTDTWTSAGSFRTGPDNALAKRQPITYLIRPYASWGFTPTMQVRITTQWGWPFDPPQIKAATLIKAARLYRRKDSPEGITGSAELGIVRVGRYDPDYDALIDRFILRGGG
jgi:hypothetical protein